MIQSWSLYLLQCFFVFYSLTSAADEFEIQPPSVTELVYKSTHTTDEILGLAKVWLAREKAIEMDDYDIYSMRYSDTSLEWNIGFQCKKPFKIGCNFGLTISDEEDPQFQYEPGK